MKKRNNILFALLLLPAALLFANGVSAAEDRTVSLRIEGPEERIAKGQVDVPTECEVLDEENVSHAFSGHPALCALQAAKDAGVVDSFSGNVSEFGFFLNSINGVVNEPWPGAFWIFRVNNATANVGVSSYEVAKGDKILFTFGVWTQEPYSAMEPLSLSAPDSAQKDEAVSFALSVWNDSEAAFQPFSESATLFIEGVSHPVTPSVDSIIPWNFSEEGTKEVFAEAAGKTRSEVVSLTIGNVTSSSDGVAPVSGGGSSGGGSTPEDDDTEEEESLSLPEAIAKAVAYLKDQNDGPTKTMALAAAGEDPDVSYLKDFSGSSAIEYAKPALALTSVGKDPRTYPDENFEEIIKGFADEETAQLGDPGLMNDDIWGILALLSADVSVQDSVIQNSKEFLLEHQNEDGGWSWSAAGKSETDMTAAAVMALLEAGMEISDESIAKARAHVRANQDETGGFVMMASQDCSADWCRTPNADTTAWVLMMLNKLGEDAQSVSWTTQEGKNPIQFLLSLQDEDGGFWSTEQEDNRMFSPGDAIIALSGKSIPVGRFVLPQATSGGGVPVSTSSSQGSSENETSDKEENADMQSAQSVAFDGEEVWGKVDIPEGAQAVDQEWDGTLSVEVPRSLKEIADEVQEGKTVEDAFLSDLDPVGFLKADHGIGERLLFDAPLEVAIPVFADEGEELFVYVRSAGQEAFVFLGICTVGDHVCRVQTSHLSQFVAVRKQAQAPVGIQQAQLEELEQEIAELRAEVSGLKEEVIVLQGQLQERELSEEEAAPVSEQVGQASERKDLLAGFEISPTQSAEAGSVNTSVLQEYRTEIFSVLLAIGFAFLGLYAVLTFRVQKRTQGEQSLTTIPQTSSS